MAKDMRHTLTCVKLVKLVKLMNLFLDCGQNIGELNENC